MLTHEIFTLWHASRSHTGRPTLAGRTDGGHHPNSGLGLFCAVEPAAYLTGFGAILHELELRPGAKLMPLTVTQLRAMGEQGSTELDRSWFEQEGQRLAQSYDAIALIELDQRVSQIIVLRDDAIVRHRQVSLAEFQRLAREPTPARPRQRP